MYNITWGRSIETSSPSAKAAPIAKPSARLWIPSPKITCKKYEYSYVDFWKEEDTHHPGHTWYIFWSRMKMGVSMAVPMVGHLLRRWSWSWWWPDMKFVKNFTPSDFQAKNFTPSISPNFNSFSDKNTKKWVKMEKFTPLAKILHCRLQWRQWQISPLSP